MKVITIGRSADNDIVVNDPKVSRHHLQIIEDNGMYRVVDFNSTNGTYVDGSRIYGEKSINKFSTIKIGGTVLKWNEFFPCEQTSSTSFSPYTDVEYVPPMPDDYEKRHSFVSFWLWLLIVANTAGIISNIILLSTLNDSNLISFVLLLTIAGTLSIVGSILLLQRKKIGFWIFAITNILAVPLGAFAFEISFGTLSCALGLVAPTILWFILQIRNKYGNSAWSCLE